LGIGSCGGPLRWGPAWESLRCVVFCASVGCTWSPATSVCVHGWCTLLDAVQLSPAKHQQEGATLYYCCSTSASTAVVYISDWVCWHCRNDSGAWPWDLHRRWPQHAVSHSADCRRLFCHFATTAQYPTIIICFPDSGCRPCADEAGLWYATLAGLPAYLLSRLQSVLNASARLITGLRRSAHITDALASFHWLRAAERIKFKLAVIVYRALHSTAPQYLSDMLRRVADIPSRSRLRSSTSIHLVVRPSRLVTVGERSFASAGARLWNSLPDDTTKAQSLPAFWRKLKTNLFWQSYPDIIL